MTILNSVVIIMFHMMMSFSVKFYCIQKSRYMLGAKKKTYPVCVYEYTVSVFNLVFQKTVSLQEKPLYVCVFVH